MLVLLTSKSRITSCLFISISGVLIYSLLVKIIMAHLLGSNFCLESLQHDIKDVQEIVDDVASRVGQVKYQSWKFPDKLSVDVDIDQLLHNCVHDDEDEEENQISHVMLYDLLIDRLVFVIQSFTQFNELLLLPAISAPQEKRGNKAMTSMSAGLSTKKCWNRMTQLAAAVQQLAKELKKQSINQTSPKTLQKEKFLSEENCPSKNSETAPVTCDSTTEKEIAAATSRHLSRVSGEVATRSCQTHLTSYTACETCSRTQACLNDVGKLLINVCKSQGLPTSLEDFALKQATVPAMSIAEMTRWKTLQSKDLSRIDRHLESLMKQIKPLKLEIYESNKREESLKDELQKQTLLSERREKEFAEEQRAREYKILQAQKALKKEVVSMANANAQYKEQLAATSIQLSDVKDELLQKHRQLMALETEKLQLKEESMCGKQHQKDALKLQSEVFKLHGQLKEMQESVKSKNNLLETETCKNRTLSSHEQAMNEKQQGLLKRLDELDEECEDLRERLSMAEEERDQAEELLKEKRQTTTDLNKQLSAKEELDAVLQQDQEVLERRVEDLTASVNELEEQLKSYVERERLLIAYPDLHKAEMPVLPESSGDVLLDMTRQVQANEIRIAVLEKENRALLKTLANVPPQSVGERNVNEHVTIDENGWRNIQPVQLWKTNKETRHRNEADEQSTYDGSVSVTGSAASFRSKTSRSSRQSLSPSYKLQPGRDTHYDVYHKAQQQQSSPVRTSFHVGPGKRRNKTPVDSRPSSGRSALLKPWT